MDSCCSIDNALENIKYIKWFTVILYVNWWKQKHYTNIALVATKNSQLHVHEKVVVNLLKGRSVNWLQFAI